MNNPYELLGVTPNSSDEEIQNAYRELAKKYHPDNYADSPLKDVANEKMAEINAAYDTIMNERRKNGVDPGYAQSSSGTERHSNFSDIRVMIQQNRLVEAEELLDGTPLNKRDAEWYFLKGSIYYSRGWLEDALNNFQAACKLDPNNMEYRAALNRMGWQRNGNMGGYGQGQYRTPTQMAGCTPCDMCSGMICADCCCESMGGDCIPCC